MYRNDHIISNGIQKKTHTKKSYIEIIVCVVVAALNVLFYDNFVVSTIVIFIELSFLTYLLFNKKITLFMGYYLIFLCLSLEFGPLSDNEQFYGFKDFRIGGVNLGILSLLPIALLSFVKGIKINKIISKYPKLFKFSFIIIVLNILGLIWGIILIVINDNHIIEMEGLIPSFIGISYNMILLPLLVIIAIFYILSWEEKNIVKLEKFLLSIFVGIVASLVISFIFKRYGYYGGVKTLQVTSVIQYIPFILLLPFYKKLTIPKYFIFVGIIGTVLTLLYNAQGKIIILYMIIPLLIAFLSIDNRKYMLFFVRFFGAVFLLLMCAYFVLNYFTNSILLNSKIDQAYQLISIWDENWLYNLPTSPRVRIVELVSIGAEYLHKPWLLLMGKGYMGTMIDHTGMLGTQYISGSFSMNQWDNGTFYRMHETLNTIFLYHGILGLAFYFYMFKLIIKNFAKNPWVLIGGFWFLMIYGFSITISAFGITALMFGLIEIDNERN